uniref:AAA+ ATPase domain-containing protein n=2 Tax=Chenopodium quinoa TaxID=63459 RepID=A0A803M1D7_CHEQI
MLGIWAKLASSLASFMFVWAMLSQFIPYELRSFIEKRLTHFYSQFHPYIEVTIPEHSGDHLKRSEAYTAVQSYLSSISSKSAKRFLGEIGRDGKSVVLSMDKHERVEDEFRGVKVWWICGKTATSSSDKPGPELMFYKITFHQKNRDLITEEYLKYVVKQGKAIKINNRQRRLYTNVGRYSTYGSMWSGIPLEHPATFDTLAMESDKKKEIMDDLRKFSNSKDFYKRIGKAWKRGYLLYGPPGTGKSTMIAAMANYLQYDIFDLELTAVKDNTELRRLLIETTSKSIIVIEDIDCSLQLTGQRKKSKEISEYNELGSEGDGKKGADKAAKAAERGSSNVTLSGLLNSIDGIWSSCGKERIIVFTTNLVEELDPALIRRGRMDKHIQMSHCSFQGFKVLAKNYLLVEENDNEDYQGLFDVINKLLSQVKITPADVAEILMPKSCEDTADKCLQKLIR